MIKLTGFFDVCGDMNNCTKDGINFNKNEFFNDLNNNYNNIKISENIKLFAFQNYKKFEEKINEEIFDLEKNPNDNIEVILDSQDEKNQKLKIDLKYNEQLAHERISKENKNSLFNNVIVVYLSGVSQFYFKTALPKLYSFIEIYDEKNKISMESFIFGKYHPFNNDTFINDLLMYYDSEINSINDILYKYK